MYVRGLGRPRLQENFPAAVLVDLLIRSEGDLGDRDQAEGTWVKVGQQGINACLNSGVNDLGGTLMKESISRAAGTVHGQEWAPQEIEQIIRAAGRRPAQRTTLYKKVKSERKRVSYNAKALVAIA